MSGFVRTLQKRILRNKFGFARRQQEVRTRLDGTTYLHRFSRSDLGPIVDGLGESTGSTSYPTTIASA